MSDEKVSVMLTEPDEEGYYLERVDPRECDEDAGDEEKEESREEVAGEAKGEEPESIRETEEETEGEEPVDPDEVNKLSAFTEENKKAEKQEMEDSIRRTFINLRKRIDYWEMCLAAFRASIRETGRRFGKAEEILKESIEIVASSIYDEITRAYRDIFMMSCFGDEEDIKEARLLAYKAFFGSNFSVSHLQNMYGNHFISMNVGEEKVFRRAITEKIEEILEEDKED